MAYATFNGLLMPPYPGGTMGGPIAIATNYLMDATGEKAGFIFQAPKTGNIRKIGVRFNTVTAPTNTDFRLESVDGTTGFPSGTLVGTNTNVTVLAAAITSNTYVLSGALTADAAVTKGQLLAAVIAPSGTPTAINLSSFSQPPAGAPWSIPYAALFTSSYLKSKAIPILGIEYDDGSYAYIPNAMPVSAVTQLSVSTATNPDEVALKFTLPAPARIVGMWAAMTADNDWDFILYDSNGTTVLESVTVDKDNLSVATQAFIPMMFDTAVEATAGVARYAAMKPSGIVTISYMTTPSAAAMDQFPGGQNFHWAQQTDAGGWTPTTTRRPLIGLIIDGISDGAGGGGGPLIGGKLAMS